MKPIFENGQIAVVTKDERAGCGNIIIHQGSIVKIHSNTPDFEGDITIFKNKKRELNNSRSFISAKKLRPASNEEILCYENHIKNIEYINNL